ncbi:MAG: beta-D-hydroxybutyrate dehydrogenase [Rhodospirillaceae bacterium]|nr:beta-D-hydroxybutyrate dehydrogenase [Rhodospirillaceae bacterium]
MGEAAPATLAGKCALVTGSTGGLGAAIARRLAREGCNVVLNGFGDDAAIEALRSEIGEKSGVEVLYHPADLARPDDIAAMMTAAAERFGGVDVLVNNAVVRHFARVDDFPVERWDEALAVNLSAAFHTVRLALPHMRARNWGRIVNMSSVYGFQGVEKRVDYVTTKTALLGFTRAVALDTIDQPITCNAVCPGTTNTPAIEGRIAAMAQAKGLSHEDAVRDYLSERQPSRRFIDPDHVAGLIVFLCSPAGADITGAALPVDGGWLAA